METLEYRRRVWNYEWGAGQHRDEKTCCACEWPRGLCDCDEFDDGPTPVVDTETAGTRAFAAAVGMVTK